MIGPLIVGTIAAFIFTFIVYKHSTFNKIKETYLMWFDRNYWTNYNVVEALAWAAKAIIIIPGLLFGLQVWWFFIIALITSMMLIWASNKKLLPSLVAFNTLWIWISCVALAKTIIN